MSNRILLTIACLAVIVCCGLTGCSSCCGPYDYHYPTFGGKHQRVDPTNGRVGSVFSDPNATFGPSSDSNLEPHPAVEAPSVPADDDLDDDDLDDDDLDDDLEELDMDDEDLRPLDRFKDDVDEIDELPSPDDSEDSEVTASRPWRQRAMRRSFEYR